MNIRDLEYLVALSEFKHFRRAADSCNVSQPTLSGQIRKLEDELGIILLERTSRKVLFTQSGMLLVDQARTVLREVKLLKEMASNQGKEMTGPLHIGLIPTVGPYLLPYIVPTLKETFPDLEVFLYEAQTHQLLEQLETGRLDCAIVARVPSESSISMNTLKGQQMLMLDDGHCLRNQTLDYCFTAGAKEDSHFQATSLETLRNMVAANAGITFMPELAVLNEGTRKGVKYIPCHSPEPARTITLVYRPGSPLRNRYERVASAISEQVKSILSNKK